MAPGLTSHSRRQSVAGGSASLEEGAGGGSKRGAEFGGATSGADDDTGKHETPWEKRKRSGTGGGSSWADEMVGREGETERAAVFGGEKPALGSPWDEAGPASERRRSYQGRLCTFNGVRALLLAGLVALVLGTFTKSRGLLSQSDSDSAEVTAFSKPWYAKLLAASLQVAIPTLETFPYPTSSYPRSPLESDDTAFPDYLSTRLGSHFSLPSAPGQSQLWLTIASHETIRLSAKHLRSFVMNLDGAANPSSNGTRGVMEARTLVILCMDHGCMKYCRDHEWFCYSGYAPGEQAASAEDLVQAKEKMKTRAIIDTLANGRRLFMVDDGVYFREDPVPHLGTLGSYDMQLPDTWSTAHTNAGFIFLNPTQNVISLYIRILAIISGPDAASWGQTNLLLDPEGRSRGHKEQVVVFSQTDMTDRDDGLFEDDALEGGYGQSEFVSAWGGGLDVKVLSRKRFKSAIGISTVREAGSVAVYLHCSCCEDVGTTDYIAGALGYHQLTLTSTMFPSSNAIDFPQILTVPTLVGTPAQLSYTLGLIMQLATDSKRTFLPPLRASLVSQSGKASPPRPIWSTFPIAQWAQSRDNKDSVVLSPGYLREAVAFLRRTRTRDRDTPARISELESTLWLDCAVLKTYDEMVRTLSQSYLADTKVVTLENVEAITGGNGWKLRPEFGGLQLCKPVAGETKADGCAKRCEGVDAADLEV